MLAQNRLLGQNYGGPEPTTRTRGIVILRKIIILAKETPTWIYIWQNHNLQFCHNHHQSVEEQLGRFVTNCLGQKSYLGPQFHS